MRRRMTGALAVVLILATVLAACSGNNGNNGNGGDSPANQQANSPANTGGETNAGTNEGRENDGTAPAADGKLSGTIEMWVKNDDKQRYIDASAKFMEMHPDVKFNIIEFPGFGEINDKFLTNTAAGGEVPDLLATSDPYSYPDGLVEDLLAPPYDAGKYQDQFASAMWERWKSYDGKKLYGLPSDLPLVVTYYRADVFEQAGFPSDPDEVGEFLKSEENLLNLAQALKAEDKYVFENDGKGSALMLYMEGLPWFDRDLTRFVRNSDEVAKGIELARKVRQLNLFSGESMWGDGGKAQMNSGKLAMIVMATWFYPTQMKEQLKESAGKWRMTVMPFGRGATAGGSTLAIPAGSDNKAAAWAFNAYANATVEGVEYTLKNNMFPAFKPAWESPLVKDNSEPFFGGQNILQVYAKASDAIKEPYYPTPIDTHADWVFNNGESQLMIWDAIDKNIDAKQYLKSVEEEAFKRAKNDLNKILAERAMEKQ